MPNRWRWVRIERRRKIGINSATTRNTFSGIAMPAGISFQNTSLW